MFKYTINPFSRFALKTEKYTHKLMNKVHVWEDEKIKFKTLELMQQNLIAVNLWIEKEFRGYKKLGKWRRRGHYKNVEKTVSKFNDFDLKTSFDDKKVEEILNKLGFKFYGEDFVKVKYLLKIMMFLKPGERFEYLAGASFKKLLIDLDKEKMIGDCNQIVTFYAFLYSLKYPIADLQIKLLNKHVCLHFKGIDIEATNGSFAKYEQYVEVKSIIDLIAVNLMDESDKNDKSRSVDNEVLLKSYKLARAISDHFEFVDENILNVYKNLAVEALNENDFKTAKYYAGQVADLAFKKYVLSREFNYYQAKISGAKTKADFIRNKAILKKMFELAKEIGNDEMIENIRKILNSL